MATNNWNTPHILFGKQPANLCSFCSTAAENSFLPSSFHIRFVLHRLLNVIVSFPLLDSKFSFANFLSYVVFSKEDKYTVILQKTGKVDINHLIQLVARVNNGSVTETADSDLIFCRLQ